jgi:hypothetical protein
MVGDGGSGAIRATGDLALEDSQAPFRPELLVSHVCGDCSSRSRLSRKLGRQNGIWKVNHYRFYQQQRPHELLVATVFSRVSVHESAPTESVPNRKQLLPHQQRQTFAHAVRELNPSIQAQQTQNQRAEFLSASASCQRNPNPAQNTHLECRYAEQSSP